MKNGQIEQLVQEHKAACQTLDDFLRFAHSETGQVLNRVRQPVIYQKNLFYFSKNCNKILCSRIYQMM